MFIIFPGQNTKRVTRIPADPDVNRWLSSIIVSIDKLDGTNSPLQSV